MAYRTYHPANGFHVSQDGNGDYKTITAASNAIIAAGLTDISIFIHDGTYPENPILAPGCDYIAFVADESEPNVIINGTCTFSSAGTVSMSGIRLQTNSAPCLSISGSAASVVNLNSCYINCLNNTGIIYSSSSGSSAVNLMRCNGDLGTTGIGYFTATGAGQMRINGGIYTNTGASTTANSTSACNIFIEYVQMSSVLSTTSSGTFSISYSTINGSVTNTTTLTTSGTGITNINESSFGSGTASAISVGTGTTVAMTGNVSSTNTNAVTGAGTFIGPKVSYSNTSSLNNVTTQTARNLHTGGISFDGGLDTLATYKTTTWTPNIQINSSNTGITYTTQVGGYTQIGNVVHLWATVVLSAKGASTGNVSISNLPIATSTNGANQCIPIGSFGQVTVVGATTLGLLLQTSSSVAQFVTSSATSGTNAVGLPNTAISGTFNFEFSGIYIID